MCTVLGTHSVLRRPNHERRRLRRRCDDQQPRPTIKDLANGMVAHNLFLPCPMMLLSTEVRQRIFKLLMARHKDMPISVAPYTTYNPDIIGHLCPEEDPRAGQLLTVCKTFHREGLPVLYGMNAMVLRNATKVAQLSNENWWSKYARFLLKEVVVSDCEKYYAVAKQAIMLHTHQLKRVVIEPPVIVVSGVKMLKMSTEEVRDEALRECYYSHLVGDPSQNVGDTVVGLARIFPAVEIVLRIVTRLQPRGRNIYPPAYFEYSAADIARFVRFDGVGEDSCLEEAEILEQD